MIKVKLILVPNMDMDARLEQELNGIERAIDSEVITVLPGVDTMGRTSFRIIYRVRTPEAPEA